MKASEVEPKRFNSKTVHASYTWTADVCWKSKTSRKMTNLWPLTLFVTLKLMESSFKEAELMKVKNKLKDNQNMCRDEWLLILQKTSKEWLKRHQLKKLKIIVKSKKAFQGWYKGYKKWAKKRSGRQLHSFVNGSKNYREISKTSMNCWNTKVHGWSVRKELNVLGNCWKRDMMRCSYLCELTKLKP